MYLGFVLSICFVNSIIVGANANKFQLYDTSSLSTQSLSLLESNSSSTTQRPRYPDTYSPGAITGVAVGSFLLIFIISMGTFCIRRQRIYYLPYYQNYRPV